MDLIFNGSARDSATSLVASVASNNTTARPTFTLGDQPLVNLYIGDGAGGYDSQSGDATVTPWLAICTPGAEPTGGTFWLGVSSATSGSLTNNKRYQIQTYVSGDDFTNVGASANASGVIFTKTNGSPTDWTHGSTLIEITTDVAYNATASVLEAALEATQAIVGVSVTKSGTAPEWLVQWDSVGAVSTMTANGELLTPNSSALCFSVRTGTSSVTAKQYVRLVQQPYALQTTWSTITNGWQGRLELNTRGLFDFVDGEAKKLATLEFQTVDGSGYVRTVGQIECLIRNEGITSASVIPTPLPSYLTASQSNLSFIQNRYAISSLTGGGTALDGVATGTTANPTVATNSTFAIEIGGYIYFYKLKSSSFATSVPNYIRPTDYNSSTNQRVWTLENVQVASSTSPYRVVATTTDATPTEMLTPTGGRLTIADNTSWLFDAKLVAQSRTYDGGNTWAQRAFLDGWLDVCSSSDGTRIAIVRTSSSGSGIYVSSDGGVTFTGTGPDSIGFNSIACTSDFTLLIAGAEGTSGGKLYKSIDNGMTWNVISGNATQPISRGIAIAKTAGGLGLMTDGANIYTSTDFITWTSRDASRAWSAVAISDDGTKLAATVDNGKIYTASSSDLTTWTNRDSNRNWTSIKLSSDGSIGVASDTGSTGGYLYTSSDSGATWTQRDSSRLWSCVAMSSDGTKQFAVCSTDFVYVSTDSGATWTAKATVYDTAPQAVCSNGDGTRPVCSGVYVGTSGSTSVSNGYCFTGTITKDTTSASTVATWHDNPIGVPTWGFAVSADTTHGALKFTVTGAVSTNISWAGTIFTSELTS